MATRTYLAMAKELALEMKVPGRVRVFELEWAQVNAVAWVTYRAVGFFRPLLEVMTQDEVRAIAVHELAHLTELQWVRTVRVVHMFAYAGRGAGDQIRRNRWQLRGVAAVMAIALAYKRFTRRMEVRADRLESRAVADADSYMRSMIKLHEANLAPAVMPGGQTHPHLYDRLLAGGIQPEFPRPKVPSRTKPLLAALAATLATIVVLFLILVVAVCSERWTSAPDMGPAAEGSGELGWNKRSSLVYIPGS